jgi:hypothetical protein
MRPNAFVDPFQPAAARDDVTKRDIDEVYGIFRP